MMKNTHFFFYNSKKHSTFAAETQNHNIMEKEVEHTEKLRYSDEELQEFKKLILAKMAEAKKNLELLQNAVAGNANEANDTAPTFKSMDEGSNVLAKEANAQLAARQQKFIKDLEAALIRIENKTYGICRITGKLIPKERLRIVPHATTTVEGKMMEHKKNRY
jgi:DnaK suppressor protein